MQKPARTAARGSTVAATAGGPALSRALRRAGGNDPAHRMAFSHGSRRSAACRCRGASLSHAKQRRLSSAFLAVRRVETETLATLRSWELWQMMTRKTMLRQGVAEIESPAKAKVDEVYNPPAGQRSLLRVSTPNCETGSKKPAGTVHDTSGNGSASSHGTTCGRDLRRDFNFFKATVHGTSRNGSASSPEAETCSIKSAVLRLARVSRRDCARHVTERFRFSVPPLGSASFGRRAVVIRRGISAL